MSPEALTAALKEEARRLGFDLVGAAPAVAPPTLAHFRRWLADGFAADMHYLAERAEAREHPAHVLPGAKSVLMLAAVYRTVEPAPAGPGQGAIARYAWGDDYHAVLRGRLKQLAAFHRGLAPGVVVRGVVDTAPLLERQFAQLAGLGAIGRNTCLIHPERGSWMVLAALLSGAVLDYDRPLDFDPCGRCRARLDACPGGALVEPYRLDARRCASYLTIESRGPVPQELRAAVGQRIFGCDACQEVCPWNRHAPPTADPAFAPRSGNNPVNLAELLAMDEAGFQQRFGGTALERAGRAGLLRNVSGTLRVPPGGG